MADYTTSRVTGSQLYIKVNEALKELAASKGISVTELHFGEMRDWVVRNLKDHTRQLHEESGGKISYCADMAEVDKYLLNLIDDFDDK